jgi:16S rRNA (guanine966-N2)-methyltransferase
MRIISGKYKGQLLVSFRAGHIRPTTDRVKETLFNKIMFEIDGTRVLDLFCGTGNLGLEAISRGSTHVTFVDAHKQSILITRDNIRKLKVEDSHYTCFQKDVLNYLRTYEGSAFDIIFADPPFTEKMAHVVMLAISESRAFADHTIITIESEKRERMDEKYGDLTRFAVKDFGDKFLSFFRKSVESDDANEKNQ